MFKRTLKLLLYLFMSSFIIFLLVEKTSGNPAILYLQRHGYTHISQENIEAAQHQLGLGHHVILRYLDWVAHAFTGDLGYSFSTREPVTSMIIQYSYRIMENRNSYLCNESYKLVNFRIQVRVLQFDTSLNLTIQAIHFGWK